MSYALDSISLFDAVPAATSFKVTTGELPTGAEVTGDDAGALYETSLSLTGFAPVCSFTTKAINSLLGFCGIGGQCVGSGFPVTQFDAFNRKLDDCDAPLSGTPHMRHRVVKGLLRLGTLTADRNVDATLSATLDAFSDGTNAPVAETDGVALPTTFASERYRLGICKIANVQFPEVEGVAIAYNAEIDTKEPALGSIWPESAGVITVRPAITFRGRDLSRVKATLIELGANGATHANTVVQLARLESGASYYDFASSNHLSITAAGLAVPTSLFSGSAGSRSTNEITLTGHHDGTNVPILHTVGAYAASP